MKSILSRNFLLLASLLLMAGGANVGAAVTTWNWSTNAAAETANWSVVTNWSTTGGVNGGGTTVPDGAGNKVTYTQSTPLASPVAVTLDAAHTIGIVSSSTGSNRAWWITNGASIFTLNMDNTGGGANLFGDTSAAIQSGNASGYASVLCNLNISNTDLTIYQDSGNSTMVVGEAIGGTNTLIKASGVHNLFLRTGSGKALTINSSIGGGVSGVITVQNLGASNGVTTITGIVGPNAAVIQNSTGSGLTLSAANSYTGATTITAGTLTLGVANAIPSVSSVSVTGTLNLNGHSDAIGALSGAGSVTNTSATAVTLTITNGSASTFSGIIGNNGAVSLTKAGGGVETLSGANTYSGNTAINGGFVNAGIAENAGVSGPFGSANATGSILFGGGTLQYSGVNQNDYSGRFDNGTLGNQTHQH